MIAYSKKPIEGGNRFSFGYDVVTRVSVFVFFLRKNFEGCRSRIEESVVNAKLQGFTEIEGLVRQSPKFLNGFSGISGGGGKKEEKGPNEMFHNQIFLGLFKVRANALALGMKSSITLLVLLLVSPWVSRKTRGPSS